MGRDMKIKEFVNMRVTVMTEMNSHRHGRHPIVLIKFSHFFLKSYLI
jgi:hypothetical protein